MPYRSEPLTETEVMTYLSWIGASTLVQMKHWFACGSLQQKPAIAALWSDGRVYLAGGRAGSIWVMIADGQRGRPMPFRHIGVAYKARNEALERRIRGQASRATKVDGRIRNIEYAVVENEMKYEVKRHLHKFLNPQPEPRKPRKHPRYQREAVKILKFLRDNGASTRQQVMAALDIPNTTFSRSITYLVRQGRVNPSEETYSDGKRGRPSHLWEYVPAVTPAAPPVR